MAKGDHLSVDCGVYWHHGLDLGDGRVRHYGRGLSEWADAVTEDVTAEEFAGGRPVERLDRPAGFVPDEIVGRSETRLGERSYCPATNNCEHFVHWCRTGRHESHQVARGAETLAGVAARAATAALARRAAALSMGTLARTAVRAASPWLLAAEATQVLTEFGAAKFGCDAATAEAAGLGAGLGSSALVGAAIGLAGGPAGAAVGAAVGVGCWAAGETVGRAAVWVWGRVVG
jgi:hypothetical protein